ncbi:MAG: hypothetical protein Tsb0013_00450 [Phycisphaerales bacterium]
MIQNAVYILLFVLGSVFVMALLSAWAAGSSRVWKTLRERYPEQPAPEFAERRSAIIGLCPTEQAEKLFGRRRGCLSFFTFLFLIDFIRANNRSQEVRVAIDDYHLHLDLDSGAAGPRAPMSIPWGTIAIGETVATHEGPQTVLTVDEFTLLVPTASIERELLMRQALEESADDNPFENAPGEGGF